MTETINIMDREHEELLKKLERFSQLNGLPGEVFTEVAVLFRTHMREENQTILPLLGYLRSRLEEFEVKDITSLKTAASRFENHYDQMLEEHREISRLLKMAMDTLMNSGEEEPMHLVRELLHHVQLEEEILYPAAFAAGDLVEFERELLGQKIKY